MMIARHDVDAGRVDFSEIAEPGAAPVRAATPGEILRDLLEERGVTAYALAKAMAVPSNRALAVLAGKRAVTADTALRLGKALDTSPEGSDNVFADLGFAEPEEELTKAELASHIRQAIRQRRLTQAAAKLMGLDQPKVSALLNGRLANFSSARLMRLLTSLGLDVDIVVRAKATSTESGRIRVIDHAA